MSPFYALNFHFISLNTIRMLGIDCANYSCRYQITNYDDVSVGPTALRPIQGIYSERGTIYAGLYM